MSQHDRNALMTFNARPTIFWYSALAGLGVAVMVTLAWYILSAQERAHIHRITASTARGVEALIKNDIEGRVAALSQLAQQWEPGMPRLRWEDIATRFYNNQPGYQAIGWVDTSLHVRWVVPLDGNEAARDFNLGNQPASLLAAQTARDHHGVVFTTPLVTIYDELGVGIYIPVYRAGTNEETFNGLTASVLLIEPLLDTLLPADLIAGHVLTVSINDQMLYTTHSPEQRADPEWNESRRSELYNLVWQVDAVPTKEFLSPVYSRLSTVMLFVGLPLSALMALTVYSAMTARYRARQVREAAGQMTALFRNLTGMAYRCANQPDWPMEFVSDGCLQLTGYARHEFEERRVSWGDLIHPDDREYVWQRVQQAIVAEESFEMEYRLLTRANEERWMWDRGQVINYVNNDAACIEGFVTDITERKRAKSKLLQEQAFSTAIVDTAFEAVISVGADGCIETFNRAAQTMFGYELTEITGKNFQLLLSEPYRQEHRDNVKRYLKTGVANFSVGDRVVEGLRKDGSEFPMQLSVSEIKHQTETKFICLIRDISLQRAAEHEAREHRARLAHVDRLNTLGEMATGIAHEINQPLTAISLFAQGGKRLLDAGNIDRLPEIFDKLSQHAQRAGAIIERMQLMARQQDNAREVVEINSLIKEIATLAEADGHIRDIVIEMTLSDDVQPVSVDVVQIQQVTLNLLRNGMEAMRSAAANRGNSIKLQTSLRGDGDVQVSIIDTGCGVSDDTAINLFTPFATTKESGMGMGLSISQSIIRAHGGQLDYYNNDTVGATFFFTLPTVKRGSDDA